MAIDQNTSGLVPNMVQIWAFRPFFKFLPLQVQFLLGLCEKRFSPTFYKFRFCSKRGDQRVCVGAGVVICRRFWAFLPRRMVFIHGQDLDVVDGWSLGSISGVECFDGHFFGSRKGVLPAVR